MTIRGLESSDNNDISDALMNYKRIIVDGEESDYSLEQWTFAIGYFRGYGLDEDAAIRAADIVELNGW